MVCHLVLLQLSAEPVVFAIGNMWLVVEAEEKNCYYRRGKASGLAFGSVLFWLFEVRSFVAPMT